MTPPAGWYPDAAEPSRLRWWDGKGWTEHTRDAPPAAQPAAVAQPSVQHDPAANAPWLRGPSQQEGSWQQRATPQGPWQAPTSLGLPPPEMNMGLKRQLWAFRYRNRASLAAIGFALLYTALAYFLHFILLGIFPILMAVGAFRRKERLAPVALLVALVPIVMALTLFHLRL